MRTFTPHQDSALKAVAAWLKAKPGKNATPQVFRLFGYAGTGKTTLARHIADGVDGEVKFAAFTGKAALVMRNKGCAGASTIHSLIYRARESGVEQPTFELWDDAPASKAKLIVIDECSMVDDQMGRDLLSFDCPLLVLGDPAQLPPIQGAGFFTAAEPDAMLSEVHRQARDDPIVRMSMDVREGRKLKIGRHGESEVVSRKELDPDRVMQADQVLVGRNTTRRAYNIRMRQRQNIEDPLPVTGDKLVCLRNNRKKGLFNGGLWRVKARNPSRSKSSRIMSMRLSPDEEFLHKVTRVSVRQDCFEGGIEAIPWEQRKPYDEFDYGYVLTVHKSQGSQWDDIVLFDESFAFQDSRARWLYTGITRAAKRLSVVL
jgi:exodeoxyribonuclease V